MNRESYLEIIGPDPSAARFRPRIFNLDTLAAPRLVTWAAKGAQLDALAARAITHRIDLGRPSPGSRQAPDGTRLTWELTDPFRPRADGLLPFFIDWGDSPHPSAAPGGRITLEDFHAEHPDPPALEAQLRDLELEFRVESGPRPRLLARLSGPEGGVVLP